MLASCSAHVCGDKVGRCSQHRSNVLPTGRHPRDLERGAGRGGCGEGGCWAEHSLLECLTIFWNLPWGSSSQAGKVVGPGRADGSDVWHRAQHRGSHKTGTQREVGSCPLEGEGGMVVERQPTKQSRCNMIPVTSLRGDRHYKAVVLLPVKAIVPDFPCIAHVPQEGLGWLGPKIQDATKRKDCGSQNYGGYSRDWWVGHKGTR